MTSRSVRVRIIAIVISVAAVLFAGMGVAAAQISGGDLPGRGRDRFVDPPGAGLLQPAQPNTILPWEQRPSGYDCRSGKRKGRKHRRC
jgi:hypothetical protein